MNIHPSTMGEDDIVELLWKRGQVVRSSQTQGPSSDAPPILRGSGSGSRGGDGEGSVQQQHHENFFIQEDEMVSWLHQPLHRDDFFYSGVSTSVTHIQSSQSLAPPVPSAPYGQTMVSRRPENFSNFSRLRCNILSEARLEAGARIEAGPSMQLGSSVTPLSSGTESSVIPTTKSTESRVSRTFAVPGLGRKEIETICEETPSSGVCKAETELIPLQSTVETKITNDRKRKEREETNSDNKETEETRGSTSRKRSRATERRRREKINEKMKTLQELIPHCNKTDRASMLDDAIEYMKLLQMQVQMMSMGQGMMPPSMIYGGHMQQLMPHMAMGMMGMSQPPFLPFPGTTLPRLAPMPGLFPSYPAQPYPFTNVQTSDPSRVHLPTPQPNPMLDQPQFPAYMNPYCQFVGLHQMQPPPPPLQSQRTSQLSFTQASSSKELEDQDKQPGG